MNVKAAIDIGSNSIKMRVGRCSGGRLEVLHDATEVVRLGRGFVDGGIAERTMERAVRVVTDMVAKARELGAETRLVGTMALRVATNAGEFLRRIREATGLDVQVISGEEEARYSWKGAAAGFECDAAPGAGDMVMFDTGGGSTEFVFGRHGAPDVRIQSVPVGAVTLSERFLEGGQGPVRQSAIDAASRYVDDLFRENGIARRDPAVAPAVLGLGGGVVAMASVKNRMEEFLPVQLHGTELTRKDLAVQMRLYASLDLEERQSIIGLPPSRADVVLGSVCIVLCALKALDVPSCRLSINGLRHGVLMEMCEKS